MTLASLASLTLPLPHTRHYTTLHTSVSGELNTSKYMRKPQPQLAPPEVKPPFQTRHQDGATHGALARTPSSSTITGTLTYVHCPLLSTCKLPLNRPMSSSSAHVPPAHAGAG